MKYLFGLTLIFAVVPASAYDLRVVPENNRALVDLMKAILVKNAELSIKQMLGEEAGLSRENLLKVIEQLKKVKQEVQSKQLQKDADGEKDASSDQVQLIDGLIEQYENLLESEQWNAEIYAADAHKRLIEALMYEPFMPLLHFNLAQVYSVNGESEKALNEYNTVINDPQTKLELKFLARFNAGNEASRAGKIDLALEHFQAALAINPESIEVKTNIELLWRQNQGGGGGGGKSKEGEGDGEGEGSENKEPDENTQYTNQPQQNRPFNSKELTKNDVRKILDELLDQEQEIRAKEYDKQPKERPRGKDW
ncbi:MAG: hypothetical protein H6626_00070 [Pseudobdellovibrionaceae bacterium]|nr:MAG: hypothetical protein H6626_00070 [Pseudobdellovibrionaceae bacterium]